MEKTTGAEKAETAGTAEESEIAVWAMNLLGNSDPFKLPKLELSLFANAPPCFGKKVADLLADPSLAKVEPETPVTDKKIAYWLLNEVGTKGLRVIFYPYSVLSAALLTKNRGFAKRIFDLFGRCVVHELRYPTLTVKKDGVSFGSSLRAGVAGRKCVTLHLNSILRTEIRIDAELLDSYIEQVNVSYYEVFYGKYPPYKDMVHLGFYSSLEKILAKSDLVFQDYRVCRELLDESFVLRLLSTCNYDAIKLAGLIKSCLKHYHGIVWMI